MIEKNQDQRDNSNKSEMLRGSAWLTAGSIISRILGVVYIIPWMIWMGNHGPEANALYAKGYNIYALFLTISTAGIPGSISKQVAHFNAKNEFNNSKKLFRNGLGLMVLLGIISALILYVFAPFLALGDERGTVVLRSLTWPLLLIPVLSIGRGYFQGFNDMKPAAISQVIEQVFRVAYMLIATYLVIQVLNGSYVTAVAQSTFAAFIGAIGGILTLIWYYLKQRKMFATPISYESPTEAIATSKILFGIVREALPFVILDNGIMLYNLIDQYTFNPMMEMFNSFSRNQLDALYALFGLNANKLIMIIISFAVAIASSSLPILAGLYAKNKMNKIGQELTNVLQLFMFVMFPAGFGMAAVAPTIYTVFYGYDKLGIGILQFSSFEAIVLGYFTILATVLQALYQNKTAIKYLIWGIGLKFILQLPLIWLLGVFGPIVATMLSFGATSFWMQRKLDSEFSVDFKKLKYKYLQIGTWTLLMYIVVSAVIYLASLFLPIGNRFVSLFILVVSATIGVCIYGYGVLNNRLADEILGSKVNLIRQKLKLK